MSYSFVDNLPLRITPHDIKVYHGESFPRLLEGKDDLLLSAIEDVYTMWHGISTLWDIMSKQVYYDKTRLCYRLLVCWYLADQYPQFLVGVPVMGGVPIKRKKIGSVDITFQDIMSNSDDLAMLNSNPFGRKALAMIKTSAKRKFLRNNPIV